MVHRDIKSHNVLVKSNNKLKLCDFGLAKYKSDLNKGSGQYSGTPPYMAPELFNKKPYSEKIDSFSFGTLMWEVVNRKIPYDGFDALQIKSMICEGKELPFTISPKPPQELIKLIQQCRSVYPDERPDFETISSQLITIKDKYRK